MATVTSPKQQRTSVNWEIASATQALPADSWKRSLLICTAVFLVLGAAWRTFRYLSQFPIWGDEAYLCLNFADHSYLSILSGTRFGQVAPILFFWSELSIYKLLGGSELAMRLFPYLVGIATLPLFWRLGHLLLSPRAAVLATGIFAVAYFPVRHACEVKPYSVDLFVALALMTLALEWRQRPERSSRLLWLCCAVVPALGFSHPSIFVAGGVSLYLACALWRNGTRKTWCLWILYNVLLVAGFAAFVKISTGMQTEHGKEYLLWYWREAFPPAAPLALIKWFFTIHTGNMFAYPIGGKNGASSLTFFLFVVGIVYFLRKRQFGAIGLLLIPFGLTFIAASLQRYPYGHSARVAQHLAPAICLLAAAGISALLSLTFRSPQLQKRWWWVWCIVLMLIGAGGFVRDIIQPYKTTTDHEGRRIVRAITSATGKDATIVLLRDDRELMPEFMWYLRQYHPSVRLNKDVDWRDLARNSREVVGLHITHQPSPQQMPEVALPSDWRLVSHQIHERRLDPSWGKTEYCLVLRWRR